MTTRTLTLAEFLRARIDDDEAVARAAIGAAVFQSPTGEWSFEHPRDPYGPRPIVFALVEGGGKTQAADLSMAWDKEERGEHIARWDPARVLAECEAKRKILDLHEAQDDRVVYTHPEYLVCKRCAVGDRWDGYSALDYPCDTVRALASVYRDHPDFRPEWA